MTNPHDKPLDKLEQYALWHEYQDKRRWLKAMTIVTAFCVLFMFVMMAMEGYVNERHDRELEQANARVLAMADELAALKKRRP